MYETLQSCVHKQKFFTYRWYTYHTPIFKLNKKVEDDLAVCFLFPAKFSRLRSCEIGNKIVLICHVISCLSWDQRIIWFYKWEPVTVRHHLTTFGVNWSGAIEDTFLICHVTSREHLNQGSCFILFITLLKLVCPSSQTNKYRLTPGELENINNNI